MNAYWCRPDRRDGKFWWYYLLVPLDIQRGRSNGKRTWHICVGFLWSGFIVVNFDGAHNQAAKGDER